MCLECSIQNGRTAEGHERLLADMAETPQQRILREAKADAQKSMLADEMADFLERFIGALRSTPMPPESFDRLPIGEAWGLVDRLRAIK